MLLTLFPQDKEKEEHEGSQDGLSANSPVSFRDKDVPQTSVHLGGDMLCFGVFITKKSESELNYVGSLILKQSS